jgi:AcrR family transcriptional regulator
MRNVSERARVPARSAAASRSRGRPPTAGLRERILRAAESVFLRQEFHEVLMDDVARASGVGKGTLYRYFPSKRALYRALLADGMDRLREELEAAGAGPDEPLAKLERLVRSFLEHFWSRRFLLALMNRPEHQPSRGEWRRRRASFVAVFEGALAEGVAAGKLRPIEPRLGANVLVGMLRGADHARAPRDAVDGLVEWVVALFLSGVGTEAGRRAWTARHRSRQ